MMFRKTFVLTTCKFLTAMKQFSTFYPCNVSRNKKRLQQDRQMQSLSCRNLRCLKPLELWCRETFVFAVSEQRQTKQI